MSGRGVVTPYVLMLLMVFVWGAHLQWRVLDLEDELTERYEQIAYLEAQVSLRENALEVAYTDLYGRWENFVLEAHEWSVEVFRATGYAPFDDPVGMCSDGNPETTATGTRPTEGRTIAVDPRVIPYGTPVWVEGFGWRLAEDTGGAIRGNRVDIMFASRADALRVNRDVIVIYPKAGGDK